MGHSKFIGFICYFEEDAMCESKGCPVVNLQYF